MNTRDPNAALVRVPVSRDIPALMVLPDGGTLVLWRVPGATDGARIVQRYDAGGQPTGAAFTVNGSATSTELFAAAAVTDATFGNDVSDAASVTAPATISLRATADGSAAATAAVAAPVLSAPAVSAPAAAASAAALPNAAAAMDAPASAPVVQSAGLVQPAADPPGLNGAPTLYGADKVNTFVSGSQWTPAVAVLNDGSYVIVWASQNQDGDQYGIFGQRFTSSGVAVGPEFQVNSIDGGTQTEPDVAALSNGGFVVTWQDNTNDGSSWGTYFQRFSAAGAAEGGNTVINLTTAGNQYHDAVAAYTGGFAVVYAADSNAPGGNNYDIYLKRYNNAGTVVTEQTRVSTTPGNPNSAQAGYQEQPDIAAQANGNLVMVWVDQAGNDGSSYGVYGRRYTASNGSFSDTFLVNTFTSGAQYEAKVAVLSDNSFVVVWRSDNQDGSSAGVYAQRFTAAGVKSGVEFRVNESTVGGQYQPAITALSEGGFVVTWYNDNRDLTGTGSTADVYIRQYGNDGTAIDGERKLESPSNSTESEPVVADLGNGNFVVAYTDYDNSATGNDTYDVSQQLFGSAAELPRQANPVLDGIGGTTVLAENLVNTTPQVYPTLALSDSDSANFAGGRLDLFYVQGGEATDQFGVRNQGNGAGEIGLSGANVRFGGVNIGTVSGGANGTALVITFNANATVEAIESLLQNLTYSSTSQSPALERKIAVRVSDGDGGSAASGVLTIRVTPEVDGVPLVHVESQVNTYIPNTQGESEIAVLTDGSYVVVWESASQDGSGAGVYAQRFSNNGVALGGEFRVNTITDNAQSYPHVAALSNGGFVITWQDNASDGSGWGIYAQRYSGAGIAQGGNVVVNSTTAGNQYHDAVAAYNGGYAVVYAADSNVSGGNSYDIYLKRFDNGGVEVTGQTRISTTPGNPNSAQSGYQELPDIAAQANGNLVIVWVDQAGNDGSSYGVYGRRFIANSNSFSDTFLVNTFTTGAQYEPSVAVLSDGSFVVVWRSDNQDGSSAGVYGQRFTAAGVKAGGEFLVNETTNGGQYQPAVTALSTGGFVVTWYNDNFDVTGTGSTQDVYIREFNNAGNPIDGQRKLLSASNSIESEPAIADLGNGNFVVTYTDYNSAPGGDNTYNIVQQLFGDPAELARQANPVIAGFVTSVTFAENLINATPQVIDSTVAVFDTDSANFAGGRLDLYYVQGGESTDQLGVRNQGNGAGQIGVAGNNVSYGGVVFATLGTGATSGANGAGLVITFNASASVEAVEALMQNLTYGSTSQSPAASRTVGVRVSDGDGGASASSIVAINVTLEADDAIPVYGESRVNTYSPSTQSEPEVAVLNDGSYVVVWESNGQDGSSNGVYAQRFSNAGVPLGTEFRVNTATANTQDYPHVAALSNGGFVITWQDNASDGSGWGIYAQRYNAAGVAQGGNVVVNSTTVGSQYHDAVAAYNGGYAVVYAADSNVAGGNSYDIYLKRFDNAGAVVTDQTRVSTTPGNPAAAQAGYQELPDIAAQANGNLVIVWVDQAGNDGSSYGVYGRRYIATSNSFSDTFLVNTNTTGAQYEPSVAVLSDGSFVVVWRSDTQDGSSAGVYGQRFTAAGVKTGGEFLVNETTNGGQYQPAVTALSTGGFVVTWYNDNFDTTGTGTQNDVYVRQYNAAGNPVDGQRKLLSPSNSTEYQPAIADLGNGNFVVVYADYNNGANGDFTYNIVQQIFGDAAELTRASNAPVLGDLTPLRTLSTTNGSPLFAGTAQVIDADLSVVDTDSANFAGGSLTVSPIGGGTTAESLAVRNQGNGALQVGVAGGNVSFGGVVVGTVSGGAAGSPLVVTFNASATAAAVQAVAQNVTFVSTALPSGTTDRYIAFSLTDGDGGASVPQVVQLRLQASVTPTTVLLDDVVAQRTLTESEANAGVLLDDAVELSYAGAAGFNNGRLTVSYASSTQRIDDQLQIRNVGAGAGQVGVAGNTVSYQGTAIGTLSATLNGTNGAVLEITFNANATDQAIERVIENLVYRNTSEGPNPSRTLNIVVRDANGTASATSTTQIDITAEADPAALVPLFEQSQVNTFEAGAQVTPSVARLAGPNNGGYVIAWTSQSGQDGDSYGVFAQRYDAGGSKVGAEFQVNSQTLGAQYEVATAGLANGGFVITWRSDGQDGSGTGVYAQRYGADGLPAGGEFQVNTVTTSNQYEPAALGLADGSFVIVYRSNYNTTGASTDDVLGQRFSATGTPLGSEFIVNTLPSGTQYQPQLAALNTGGFVAIWTDTLGDGSGYRIVAQRFAANGNKVGSEIQVNTSFAGNQVGPDVAGFAAGGFVAVWDDGSNILAQRFNAAGALVGGEIVVNTADSPSSQSNYARVVTLDNGGFIVTWDGSPSGALGGSSQDVLFQQFDANGVKVDGPVIVNTTRASTQYEPDIAVLTGNNVVITWAGYDQEAGAPSTYGIHQQLLGTAGSLSRSAAPQVAGLPDVVAFDENVVNAAPVTLVNGVSVTDADSANFDGGRLWVSVVQGYGGLPDAQLPVIPATQDQIGIRSQGNGAGQVAVVGSTVSVGGTAVGTIESNGANGTDLIVRFNVAATAEAVEAVIQNLTYANTSSNPLPSRTLSISLNDGDGGTSVPKLVTVQVNGQPDGAVAVFGNERVNTFTAQTQGDVAGARLADGSYVLAWTSTGQDGSGNGVHAQRFAANGTPIGIEIQLHSFTIDAQQTPSVAALSGGGFVAMWQSSGQDGSSWGVYGQVFNAAGLAVGSEFQVNTTTVNEQSTVDVVGVSGGGFVATWYASSQGSSNWDIYAQRFNAAGAPVGLEFKVNTNAAFTTAFQATPEIAAFANGGFVIVWRSDGQDGSGSGVYAQRFNPNGTAAGSEFAVNTFTSGAQYEPDVAVLNDGSFIVVWRSDNQDGSSAGVYGQRFSATGVKQGAEFRVNTDISGAQYEPSVTALSNGGFAVAWNDSSRTYVQQFTAAGLPVDGATLVDVYDNSAAASDPTVVGLDDGAFVVAWTDYSYSDSPASYDIYQQLFHPNAALARPGSPVLTGVSPTVTFVEQSLNRGPQLLDNGIGLFDPDSADFDGGLLEVARINDYGIRNQIGLSGIDELEQLGIRNQGNGAGQVGVSGNVISLGGVAIGTLISDGANGARLAVQFNANANSEAVERVIENLTFGYTGSDPIPSRTLAIRLTDGDGGASQVRTVEVQITPSLDATHRVGPEQIVNTTRGGTQVEPSVARLSDGGYVVVWEDQSANDGNSYGVYGQRYDASNTPVGAEFRVNTLTTGAQYEPQVAALSGGGFVVVWRSDNQDGSGAGIFAQRYAANGNPAGAEFRVNTSTVGNQYQPQVASTDSGGFIVTWYNDGFTNGNAERSDVFFQRYNANGGALGVETRANPAGQGTSSFQYEPAIAWQASGAGFVAVWRSDSGDGSGAGIFAQRFNGNGVAQGASFQVNTSNEGNQTLPAVAMLKGGGFVVTWRSEGQDTSSGGVFAQRFDALGAKVGGEFRVNTSTSSDQTTPQIVALENGGWVIAWADSGGVDGSGWGVFAQHYDAFGRPMDGETQINAYSFSTQNNPALAAMTDGGFVAAYAGYLSATDSNGDGVPDGGNNTVEIRLQRYSTTPPVVTNVATTILEDVTAPVPLSVFESGFSDVDGQLLTYIRIVSLPRDGSLRLDGVRVVVGQEISREALEAGRLTYRGDADYYGPDLFRWLGSDGIIWADNPATVNLTITNVNDGPRLDAGADDAVGENQPYSHVITLNDPDPEGHRVTINWGDGTTTTVDVPNQPQHTINHVYTTSGNYTVTVTADDQQGLPNSVETDTYQVEVNEAPTATLRGRPSAAEGRTYTLTVDPVVDPDGGNRTSYTIDWGDGTSSTFNAAQWAAAAGVFTHVYADGPPLPGIDRLISVQTTDQFGTHVLGTKTVAVRDVAPRANIGGNATVNEGSTYVLRPAFVDDPGQDTRTSYSISWGDGTQEVFTPEQWEAAAGRFTHVYADGAAAGTLRTVTVRTTDEDGTFALGNKVLTVNNVAPTAPVSGPAAVAQGALYTLTVGTITDPGTDRRTSYSIDWGDGNVDTFTVNQWNNAAGTFTHTYGPGGVGGRQIVVSTTDDDGTFVLGTRGITVNSDPVGPAEAASFASLLGSDDALTVVDGQLQRLDSDGQLVGERSLAPATPAAVTVAADLLAAPDAPAADGQAALDAMVDAAVDFDFSAVGVPASTDHLIP